MPSDANTTFHSAVYDAGYGRLVDTRAGKAHTLYDYHIMLDVSNRLPLVTLKETKLRYAAAEFCWLLQGHPDVTYLEKANCPIWRPWYDTSPGLNYAGPFGYSYVGLINHMAQKGIDRRAIINLWKPEHSIQTKLPPCYPFFQFVEVDEGKLSLIVTMRSLDIFIGLPYDMVVFYLILRTTAEILGMQPEHISINIGNCHMYECHDEHVDEIAYRHFEHMRTPVDREIYETSIEWFFPFEGPRTSDNILGYLASLPSSLLLALGSGRNKNYDYGFFKVKPYKSLEFIKAEIPV